MEFSNLENKKEIFGVLYEEHAKTVLKHLLMRTNDKSLAEDVLQESFYIAYKKLETLNSIDKFAGWIHIIAFNELRRQLKKYKNSKEEIRSELYDTDFETTSQVDELTPEEKYLIVEEINITTVALQQLSHNERDFVFLKYRDGLSYEEIGLMFDIKADKIRFKMPGILKKLRKIITKYEVVYER